MVLQKDSFVLYEILSLLERVCYEVLKLDLWELHQYSSVMLASLTILHLFSKSLSP